MARVEAIVLHTFRYGESSHIVQLLSREHGLLSCMVKGTRRRSPLPPVLMQPLSLVEVVMDVRPNRQFQFLRESAPLALYDGIAGNPAKNAMALFLCEILCRALRESPADVRLFDFVADSVAVLVRVERGVVHFHWVCGRLCWRAQPGGTRRCQFSFGFSHQNDLFFGLFSEFERFSCRCFVRYGE